MTSEMDDRVGYYDLVLASDIRIGWSGLSNVIDHG
jgi:hypothetical protein